MLDQPALYREQDFFIEAADFFMAYRKLAVMQKLANTDTHASYTELQKWIEPKSRQRPSDWMATKSAIIDHLARYNLIRVTENHPKDSTHDVEYGIRMTYEAITLCDGNTDDRIKTSVLYLFSMRKKLVV